MFTIARAASAAMGWNTLIKNYSTCGRSISGLTGSACLFVVIVVITIHEQGLVTKNSSFRNDFWWYSVCPILLGQMGIWQNWLSSMVEHPNQSQPNRLDTLQRIRKVSTEFQFLIHPDLRFTRHALQSISRWRGWRTSWLNWRSRTRRAWRDPTSTTPTARSRSSRGWPERLPRSVGQHSLKLFKII